MRQIQNIGRMLLSLLMLGLVSCNQDEMNELGNPNSNNETKVPEGYMLVSFPIQDEFSTRAELKPETGTQKRIQHLQYLLYKKPDGGSDTDVSAWILEKKGLVNENESGIYFPYSFALPLPIDNTYKIVFLANVSEGLFKGQQAGNALLENTEVGQSTYSQTTINAPDVAFGENNMYYLASATFNTHKAGNESTKDVTGICLQRMVSRSLLTTYGIQGNYDESETSYEKRYYSSLLGEDAVIGKLVFANDINSALGEQFHQLIMEDIVYPFAYLLNKNSFLNEEMLTWFEGAEDEFRKRYAERGFSYDNIVQKLEGLATEAGDFTQSERAAVLQSFILSLKKNSADKDYIGKMLTVVKSKDICDVTQPSESKGSFTIAKQKTLEQLRSDQRNGGLFGVWSKNDNMMLTVTARLNGKVPTAVDLDLNVQKESESFSREIALAKSTDTEDSSLPIILLAGKNDNHTFGLQALDNSENLRPKPENGITNVEVLRPNISTTYRVTPTDIKWDGTVKNNMSRKVIMAYGSLIDIIGDLSADFKQTLLEADIKIALSSVYGVTTNLIDFERKDGRLSANTPPVGFVFSIPDFSRDHLTGTLIWKAD